MHSVMLEKKHFILRWAIWNEPFEKKKLIYRVIGGMKAELSFVTTFLRFLYFKNSNSLGIIGA